jgi:hypothetical protein
LEINQKKNENIGAVPKYNRKIIEKDKIDTPNIYIHYRSLSWFAKAFQGNRVKLVLWAQASLSVQ